MSENREYIEPVADLKSVLELKTSRKVLNLTLSADGLSVAVVYEDAPGIKEVYAVGDIDPL